jgi:hypothetical protein
MGADQSWVWIVAFPQRDNRHLQLIKLADKVQAIEKDNGHQTGKSDESREQVSPPSTKNTPRLSRSALVIMLRFNFFDQLIKLLALAGTHVEEADTYGVAVVDSLHNPAQSEGQTLNAKLGFNARVNAYWEKLVATDPTAANADIDNSPDEPRANSYQDDDRGVVHR